MTVRVTPERPSPHGNRAAWERGCRCTKCRAWEFADSTGQRRAAAFNAATAEDVSSAIDDLAVLMGAS